MSDLRQSASLLLIFLLTSTPAMAQQSIAASAAAQAGGGTASTQSSRRPMFWTGVTLGIAGGVAIIAGSTVGKTADATSGNTPPSGFDSCVALKANPVYAGNSCDVLKGPNKAVVIGGVLAAATGITLAAIGAPHSSITFGPGTVRFRHRLSF